MSAVKVALPAFATQRRAAVQLLLSAGSLCTAHCRAAIDRYLLPAVRSAGNPQQRRRMMQRTDTDGRSTVTQILFRILCWQCQKQLYNYKVVDE